jgi:tRNA A-37 threonylcarbamoyl transferase component Bud32
VYKATFLGRPTIVKERFTKAYRLPELDVKLNQSRITQVRPPTTTRVRVRWCGN